MEQDRYQKNHSLFIVGMISLMLGLMLLLLSLYLLPNLLFGWHYAAPPFIIYMNEWLRQTFEITTSGASKIIFFVLLGLALIFIGGAYFSSNRIENQIYENELQETEQPVEETKEPSEGKSLVLKLLLLIFVVFVVATFFHWLIYNEPTEEQNEIIQPSSTGNETIGST